MMISININLLLVLLNVCANNGHSRKRRLKESSAVYNLLDFTTLIDRISILKFDPLQKRISRP